MGPATRSEAPSDSGRLRALPRSIPVPLLAAGIALLPFLPAIVLRRAFYFRDLTRYFIPVRRFLVESLRSGQLPLWDPWVHEGAPDLPLFFYLPDLLALPGGDEASLSLVLALHVGLAAGAMAALVGSLGGRRVSALAGGIFYAFCGYGLSLLNLDIALRAYAWAPLVVLTLRRAVAGGRVEVGVAAATVGVALTTLSPEILLQAILLALLLSLFPLSLDRFRNAALALALAAGIAAAPLLLQASLVPGSARGELLAAEDSVTDTVPAVAWIQMLVVNLLGDLGRLGDAWWGYEHYRRGFPYMASLYVGATALSLAVVGLLGAPWLRGRLAAALGLALLVIWGAGQSGLAGGLMELVPLLRMFRYPVKLFFTIQFAAAVLAAGSIHVLAGARAPWKTFAVAAASLGALLVLPLLVSAARPEWVSSLLAGVFPAAMQAAERTRLTAFVVGDAALGGTLALVAAMLAIPVLRGRLRPSTGAGAVVALLAADLLRAGAGLNPTVSPDFYAPSPPSRRLFEQVAAEDGRLFTCDLFVQRGYAAARAVAGDRGATFAFAAMVESAMPHANVPFGIPTARSQDLVSLVPVGRALEIEELACDSFSDLEARLRLSGVTHVVSADPLTSGALELETVVRPERLAPLALFAYRLTDPLPRYEVARRAFPASDREAAQAAALADPTAVWIEGLERPSSAPPGRVIEVSRGLRWFGIEVEAGAPAQLVVREGFDTAWRATVDGRPVPVRRANGRHMAVPIPAGRSRVELRYRPRVLLPGLAVSLASALGAALLVFGPWKAARERPAADQ